MLNNHYSIFKEGCDIGIGVCTKQYITVGENSVIGGQTMLTKDVQKNSLVFGVPNILRGRAT